MASIRKKGNSWEAQVCRHGARRSKSFLTKGAARNWGIRMEAELDSAAEGGVPDKTFGELLTRYGEKVSVTKRGERWEKIRIELINKDPISAVNLKAFNSTHVADWRDRRKKQVSASSVRREWALLSHACTIAMKEWKWIKHNPFMEVIKPDPARPRSRRIDKKELELLLYNCGYIRDKTPVTATARVGATLLFALETGMRAGEITSLVWSEVHDSYVYLPMTKNGRDRKVPLSEEAKRLIAQMKGNEKTSSDERVFGLTSAQLDALFRKVRDRCGITGLRFHDSRREALTRLAKKLDLLELASVSGHLDVRTLRAVYYAPDVEEIAAKL